MNTNNDSIIRNSNEEPKLYDNYKKSVNNYIESQLGTINNTHFNHIENNEDKEGKNSELTKQKKVYLNTYIIPLLYLINSYMYQKYLNNKKNIVNNILINDEIDYYSKYFFDYKLPIVKKFNIAIYKNYFKNKNDSKSNSESNSESNSKKINNSKIKLIIGHLTNINKDLIKLSEPYKIKQEIENLRNQFSTSIGRNNETTFTEIDDKILKISNKKNFIKKLKDIQKIYQKDGTTQKGGTLIVTDEKIRKKFIEAIKHVLDINNNNNPLIHKISELKIKTIKKMIKYFVNMEEEKENEAATEKEKKKENEATEKKKATEATEKKKATEATEKKKKANEAAEKKNYIPIIIPEIL